MNYEKLLMMADDNNLIAKEKNLPVSQGRIKGNRIAIRKNMPTVQKACVLAEELGHYHTTYGDILNQDSVSDQKQEQRARLWAYDKMVGLHGIIAAYKHGCRSFHETADFLEVTEEFLNETLAAYRSKYGCYATVDNYIICFEPALGVLEMI